MIGSVLSIVGQLVSVCIFAVLMMRVVTVVFFFVSAVLFYTNRTKISCKVSLFPHYFCRYYNTVPTSKLCCVRTCCFDVLFFTHHNINSGFFT